MANIFNPSKPKNNEVKTVNHAGGTGVAHKPELDLALMVVSSYLNDNFYEKAEDRVTRLIAASEKVSPDFAHKLAIVARKEFNNRTTPVALIAMQTLLNRDVPEHVINNVFLRGDEVITYIAAIKALSNKKIVTGKAKKVANIALNNMSQRKALRYMGGSKAWNLADVIRVVHPQARTAEIGALFEFIIAAKRLDSMSGAWESLTENQRDLLAFVGKSVNGTADEQAATSWEKARSNGASWQSVVDGMGYMALLRNVRNFLSDVPAKDTAFWDKVIARLRDRKEVLKSQQMPYRFLSAYRAIGNSSANAKITGVRNALEEAMEYSLDNIPELNGKTLVLVDTSGSMSSAVSGDSDVRLVDVAGSLGMASARRFNADVVEFATDAASYGFNNGKSVLKNIEEFCSHQGRVGHGTTMAGVPRVVKLKDYENVIIFSDMQMMDASGYYGDMTGKGIFEGYRGKIFSVNLAAYESGFVLTNRPNVYTIGGFSDATLRLIGMSTGRGIVDYIKSYEL